MDKIALNFTKYSDLPMKLEETVKFRTYFNVELDLTGNIVVNRRILVRLVR